MEYIAVLHVTAHSPVEASIAWSAAFKDQVNDAWHVDVWDLDGKDSSLENSFSHYSDNPLWQGDGYKYWSGGYQYFP